MQFQAVAALPRPHYAGALVAIETTTPLRRCYLFVSIPATMIELEVYAPGLRELSKILELDHQLVSIAGLHYKVDRNHDLVYLEFDQPTVSVREIRAIFRKLGLDPIFIGTIPPELRPRTKTEPLNIQERH